MLDASQFEAALCRVLDAAAQKREPFVEVNSGLLHRQVGGYPGPSHRIPVCCQVLYDAMLPGDEVVSAPPKGNGASVTIRYRLPRERPQVGLQHPLIGPEVVAAVNAVVPHTATHVGFVALETTGQVMVAEPAGHPKGVSATFCKVAVMPEESSAVALQRSLADLVGMPPPLSIQPLPTLWFTSASAGFYFAAVFDLSLGFSNGRKHPIGAWCSPEEAERRISQSANPTSRRRDLALLVAAQESQASAPRRVLLMLQELHRRGFQRLRLEAEYDLRMGMVWPHWSARIVPSNHPEWSPELKGFGPDLGGARFSITPSDLNLFGWGDAYWDSSEALADKFLSRFRDLAMAGWGPDPAYAQWLSCAVLESAPHGVVADTGSGEYLTLYAPERRLLGDPCPPPD